MNRYHLDGYLNSTPSSELVSILDSKLDRLRRSAHKFSHLHRTDMRRFAHNEGRLRVSPATQTDVPQKADRGFHSQQKSDGGKLSVFGFQEWRCTSCYTRRQSTKARVSKVNRNEEPLQLPHGYPKLPALSPCMAPLNSLREKTLRDFGVR